MRIDRWNGGHLRRYRHPSGAVVVVCGRTTSVIPAWCAHISAPITRATAAEMIRDARQHEKRSRADG